MEIMGTAAAVVAAGVATLGVLWGFMRFVMVATIRETIEEKVNGKIDRLDGKVDDVGETVACALIEAGKIGQRLDYVEEMVGDLDKRSQSIRSDVDQMIGAQSK